jgi:hypothetical protein
MKNIHVLPTEKPSRLFVTDGKLFNYHKPQKGDGIKIINQNIYITSDEEIKVGDYVINSAASYVFQHYFAEGNLYKECKKIILTTDQDLIDDGVQSIDDEFLEWFVNNPSCEEVEIEDISMQYHEEGYYEYKIIIPKEIGFKVENGKRTETFYQKFKQETLEEAKKYLSNEGYGKASNFTLNNVANLMLKWQQEQDKKIYSEEEVLDILFTMSVFNPTNITELFEKFKRLNCKHKNIKREDGLDECLDCGVTNY